MGSSWGTSLRTCSECVIYFWQMIFLHSEIKYRKLQVCVCGLLLFTFISGFWAASALKCHTLLHKHRWRISSMMLYLGGAISLIPLVKSTVEQRQKKASKRMKCILVPKVLLHGIVGVWIRIGRQVLISFLLQHRCSEAHISGFCPWVFGSSVWTLTTDTDGCSAFILMYFCWSPGLLLLFGRVSGHYESSGLVAGT